MKGLLAAGLLFTCIPYAAGAATGCGDSLGETRRIEGANYTVAYRTAPDPIRVGAHFALDFAVCPRAEGAAAAPRSVRVDATMPEHRHGMNYRPVVTARPGGAFALYRAEGLMFHMPGRWDLTFDVETDGRTERLTGVLLLE
jgi:hypothetical protein